MSWRFWLIELPARIVSWWFFAYWIMLTVVTALCIITVCLMLALALLGIRWGY